MQAPPAQLRFRLTRTTQLVLVNGSITNFDGDALVCPGNERMMGPLEPSQGFRDARLQRMWLGFARGSIHSVAGPALQAAFLQVPEVEAGVRCPTGEARMTLAGNLGVRHVIHTVGPVYTFPSDSAPLLERAYRSCLALANDHKLRTLALPAISCGGYGYPPTEAAEIALRVCAEAAGRLEEVHFYLLGEREMMAWLLRAQASLEALPQRPAAQSVAVRELMRAAQAGQEDEVVQLLVAFTLRHGGPATPEALSLAGCPAGGAAGAAAAGAQEGEGHSPGSSSPRDRGASRSHPDLDTPGHQQALQLPAGLQADDAQQQQRPAAGNSAGSSSSGGRAGPLDVRRWTFEYGSLRKLSRLGSGSFGEVWLSVHSGTGTTFAVKELFRPPGQPGGGGGSGRGSGATSLSQPEMREFRKEAELMADLRHPHVLAFMGICMEPPCIVTEYCSQGSLFDILRAAGKKEVVAKQLTWIRRLSLLWGVAKGMLALHSHQPPIIHRDLRSPNVLIDRPWIAKVADFNLSRGADDSAGARTVPSLAANRNPRWLAPEVLASITHSDLHPATKASDVYQFACVMYEMLTWQIPWAGVHDFGVIAKMSTGMRPPVPPRGDLPGMDTAQYAGLDAYVALMTDCWATDPAARPAFGEIAERLKELLHEQHLRAEA